MATGAYDAHVAYQQRAGAAPPTSARRRPRTRTRQVRVAEAAAELDAAWLALERNMTELMGLRPGGREDPDAAAAAGPARPGARHRPGDQRGGPAVRELRRPGAASWARRSSGSGGTRTPAGCTRSTTRSGRCRCSAAASSACRIQPDAHAMTASGRMTAPPARRRPPRRAASPRRPGCGCTTTRPARMRRGRRRWCCCTAAAPARRRGATSAATCRSSPSSFRTLMLDQPGFGQSDRPPVTGNYFTFAADALAGLLDHARHRAGAPGRQLARRRHRGPLRAATTPSGRAGWC